MVEYAIKDALRTDGLLQEVLFFSLRLRVPGTEYVCTVHIIRQEHKHMLVH
jgi:hypothetical protein